ncbi:Methyltransferase domain protein [Aquimixticola soesokkakensis]|uniref:Methyltransferase domain protein n=1 Tax=Aquimixticola soesokkakensis TaxID=1519096 RepID=A0A1Y5R7P7_9RHOB|nr:methyltransferase domain-containing protein [Aquimixticola soesokkakensis]SLN11044.1 Methyltransferase domain protein [Aquimixticola soesokkakensis]
MTTRPPDLTDRPRLEHARNRARKRGLALFLHEEARTEVEDRLMMVNKAFTDVAIVTGFPEAWRESFPNAVIVPDEDHLALAQGQFDLVIHALSLHWANDPVGQLVQARRALRPDGLLIAACFGGQTLHELRSTLAETEVAISGGLSPRVVPMGEIRDLGGLLQRAGFALPVADLSPRNVSYASLFDLMRDLRAMGETNALAARLRRATPRALFAQAAALYQSRFPAPSNPARIAATFDLVFLTAWAPDESQQKPLRPGSAQARLADALGTRELTLPKSDPNTRQTP